MSSGFGFKGTANRCYAFWKDVERCNVEAAQPGQCSAAVEDYLECLHHKKELARMNAIIVHKEQESQGKAHGGGGH
ncbi:hypothetical protein H257_06847 [Aphanomyces astaci]|uniref:NADH dehydrogenase [ubiquinone] iron-sulfur protein 5 n=1 Tax=Aphanomyces astaci TaxID=112090 RepID=W4GL24_APHAT|nr:hypothetical protein H257_06847 [Aphanomyces astaci]ETV79588.1 hypothetical protein H257_06847 [Aphanomyces astaci]|eukprot:XP_009830524.1 hypothetical protein H257_06847 [Aphanomyces astaci]